MQDRDVVVMFFVGVATSLVLVLVWDTLTGDAPERASSGTSQLADDGSAEEPGAAGPAAGPATRLTRCTRAARALHGPLQAARPALDQWAVHVDAMNKLVVGEITLQQAADFWSRTRVGAQRRVDGFRDAWNALQRRGVDCPRPDLLAEGSRALPACAQQVDGQVRVLRAARTSLELWAEHIQHMDMLRVGTLSPEAATRMWLSMWRRGARDLDAYRRVAREAERLDGCRQAGASG